LQVQMERLGPIRLSDLERAQQSLAHVAADLICEGTIPPPKNRRFISAA
jgi:flagellar motor switch protein FliG